MVANIMLLLLLLNLLNLLLLLLLFGLRGGTRKTTLPRHRTTTFGGGVDTVEFGDVDAVNIAVYVYIYYIYIVDGERG